METKEKEKLETKQPPVVAEPPTADDFGEVKIKRIEVAGIIKDDQGNEWTIPEKDDLNDAMRYKSPYAVKLLNNNDDFHIQFERRENVPQMMAEGFVPVTRKELGLDKFKRADGAQASEFGIGIDSYYVVGGTDVCIKIPKVLADRRYKALKTIADAAVQATEPHSVIDPENAHVKTDRTSKGVDALSSMKSNREGRRYHLRHESLLVRPRNPENSQVQGQEE